MTLVVPHNGHSQLVLALDPLAPAIPGNWTAVPGMREPAISIGSPEAENGAPAGFGVLASTRVGADPIRAMLWRARRASGGSGRLQFLLALHHLLDFLERHVERAARNMSVDSIDLLARPGSWSIPTGSKPENYGHPQRAWYLFNLN